MFEIVAGCHFVHLKVRKSFFLCFFFFFETRCFRPVFVDPEHKLDLERYPRYPATVMAVAGSLYVSLKGLISGANPS